MKPIRRIFYVLKNSGLYWTGRDWSPKISDAYKHHSIEDAMTIRGQFTQFNGNIDLIKIEASVNISKINLIGYDETLKDSSVSLDELGLRIPEDEQEDCDDERDIVENIFDEAKDDKNRVRDCEVLLLSPDGKMTLIGFCAYPTDIMHVDGIAYLINSYCKSINRKSGSITLQKEEKSDNLIVHNYMCNDLGVFLVKPIK